MLKCVAVDDDALALSTISDLCHDSQNVKLLGAFQSPKDFLKRLPELNFDICLLDICMREMDGFTVAEKINGKPIIFITAAGERLNKAMEFSPVDILVKPVLQSKFNEATQKACKLLGGSTIATKKESALFSVAEANGKVKITFSDILFVESDEIDPRNKVVTLKGDKKLTVMGYSFHELTSMSNYIIQVNRSQAVAIDKVNCVKYDLITLEWTNNTKEFTLNRKYRKDFHSILTSR